MSVPLFAREAAEKTPAPFRVGAGRRVYLWDGERITGQLLNVSEDTVRLRTAWAARLEVPRTAVASIEPLPGWRTILDEDFHIGPGEPATLAAGMRYAGNPSFVNVKDGTAGRALLLRAPGQSLPCSLNEPLAAGRVGVNFREQGQARGARWTVALLFQQGKGSRAVRVTVAGNGSDYSVETSGLMGTMRKVARTPGWHRLIVSFSKQALRLTCDDDVLWYNLDKGPDGPLQQVTIACQQAPENDKVQGAVAWTEISIERAVDEHPLPPADGGDKPRRSHNVVRLHDDDQLFGRILQADRHTIQIEGHFGKRALPWTAVSGCSFRRPAALLPSPPTPLPAGERGRGEGRAKVRLLLHSGLCAESDVLEGVVTASDKRQLVLRHAILGELSFERSRVRQVQSLPNGAR